MNALGRVGTQSTENANGQILGSLVRLSRAPTSDREGFGFQQSGATPQAPRGRARLPCRHFKNQCCFCLGSLSIAQRG
jgi:hypothetical protein